MAILKCKMCGGDLEVSESMTVAECEYCGTKQTVPIVDDEKKIKLFERANKLRSNCEFDKAASVYENIVTDYSEEAEGYWGLILCRYGIEYVDDPMSGKKIPTCHRSSFDSIMDDEDFELVMENSDVVSRAIYREEAKYIEDIRKGIIEVSGKEEPYDIFICYKETDENAERTLDSVLAQDVYDELTCKGYRTFFSRITLEDKLGIEYEPYIFAALNSAKIMLAFGTSYDFYNAVWVKNEWSRYLKLMTKDKSKHLIPCFKNLDAYDIPKEFAKLQAQDMGKIGAIQDLMRGIDKLLAPEMNKDKTVTPESIMFNSTGANGNAFLKRGFMALEDNEWSKATEFFEQVLNINAEDGQAYFGELLAEQKCIDVPSLCKKLYNMLAERVTEVSLEVEVKNRYTEFGRKYFFLPIFSRQEIQDIFYKKFIYKSTVSSIEDIISANREQFILANNKLYQRALQYADGNLRAEIAKMIQIVEEYLQKLLVDAKEAEQASMGVALAEVNTYFEKLDCALHETNIVAMRNAEKNEADYQVVLSKWMAERDSLKSRHLAWQKEMEEYEIALDNWKNLHRDVMEKWDKDKTKYAEDKREIEAEIRELEDQKRLVDGFKKKIKKLDEEIYMVKNKMMRLIIPAEPVRENSPTRPIEPTLREMPILTFEDKVVKEEVRQVFMKVWEQ
ncbi:TIR domain-containing protein [Anaerosporobacter sp.]|uniref:TIR domain-containing protein n=1 Tax=Anaerosporobacter sp. TaxID=1872529 RepID=UPI00286EC34A|nr:TIR domain-containing protein [Anaerosporobacter sp.]